MPCWNKSALSYRKLTCDDTIQTVAQVVTSSALSLYIVWRFLDDTCISYDIPLKRCLKGSFLLPLLTCVFPSLTISAIFISHLALPSLALLLSLWVLLWFKTTYRPHPMPPCLILIPKTCVLCSNNLMSSQKLARKFEIAQIFRKLTQASTSHCKLAVKRGTSMHMYLYKLKLAMTCVLVWSGL